MIFVMASNYFAVLAPQVTGYVINQVQQRLPNAKPIPEKPWHDPLVQWFVEVLEPYKGHFLTLITICSITILVLAILRGVLMFFMRQTIIVMSRHIEFDQKNQVYQHYQKLDTNFYKTHSTGDLMNRITEDVSRVRMYTGPAIMYLINLVTLIGFCVVNMVRKDAMLTLYVLAPLPILALTIYVVNTIIHKKSEKIQALLSDLTTNAQESTFGQAGQDLAVRAAQAYFDVLAAQDTLALVQAQKAAISEQLAQAKRNFEVGTATITDTHEAQARFDLSSSQEIAALNDLETKKSSLQQITGKQYAGLRPLRPEVRLTPPNPANMQSWVDIAEKQGYPVQIQESVAEIAQLEAKRQAAGHYPTVDLVASYGWTSQTASQLSAVPSNVTSGVFGLQLGLPLYQGGAISSREREAAALYEKSKQDLENARRTQALTARQTYLSVTNGIAQVGALEQALVSSQSALDSNKLGYEVGVRINIDVLNAQQQLFSTRRDLATARYNTITSYLRLKAAAGSLKEDDLGEVNKALQP